MSETILKALIQLFAIIANVEKARVSKKAKNIVGSYLKQKFNKRLVDAYLSSFDKYVKLFHNNGEDGKHPQKRSSLNSVKVLKICQQVNENLQQKEKLIVLVRLIEFVFEDAHVTNEEQDFIRVVADTFNIRKEILKTTLTFVTTNKHINNSCFLAINNKKEKQEEEHSYHIPSPNLSGEINVLYISHINIFILKYIGNDYLWLNSQHIYPERIYMLNHGAIIKGKKIKPIYYSDIASVFLNEQSSAKIRFLVNDIEFKFPNSDNGIKKFRMNENSGQLIGVMGGSGAGKSTLFDLLNGRLMPNSGTISINGCDIHGEDIKLKGVIGFVPQDDLLIEELTVFQNLYFSAKLCFNNYSEQQILKTIFKTLNDLDLTEIKDLKVGSPLHKVISGGQRKRLNIALELMREPSVLFVDEPTSGLSSLDSEMVMLLLKQQTLKGRLLFTNIHQPSSNIFKLFDKLLIIDKGGHIIFQGNPIDAITYFKTICSHADANDHECSMCGNVNPEQVLEVVEEKMVNEFGKLTHTRKMSPKDWFAIYKEKIESKVSLNADGEDEEATLPENMFSVPGLFSQFKIFLMRSVLARFANKQYVIVNFLVVPLLAIILGFFTKSTVGGEYIFSENENIFAFLFMAVVVALFIGMTVSAEEIIRDRKILKREGFLNLSWFSYINSKVVMLFVMSAVQMLLFVLIANNILEIKDMTLNHWLVLFSTACFANLVGLNISAALNSVVSIYILIPFILVPQLLLGGVLVSYEKLHHSLSRSDCVPFVGDMMTSRWAFEALVVSQFKDNAYAAKFYPYDQKNSNLAYEANYLIPALEKKIDLSTQQLQNKSLTATTLTTIKNGLAQLSKEDTDVFKRYRRIKTKAYNSQTAEELKALLEHHKIYCYELKKTIQHQRDSVYKHIEASKGREAMFEMKKTYTNKRLNEFVTNKSEIEKIEDFEGKLIRKKDPAYAIPVSQIGRAHFYAPVKNIAGKQIDTFWFNIFFIWLMSLFAYILLQFDLVSKAINYFSRYKSW